MNAAYSLPQEVGEIQKLEFLIRHHTTGAKLHAAAILETIIPRFESVSLPTRVNALAVIAALAGVRPELVAPKKFIFMPVLISLLKSKNVVICTSVLQYIIQITQGLSYVVEIYSDFPELWTIFIEVFYLERDIHIHSIFISAMCVLGVPALLFNLKHSQDSIRLLPASNKSSNVLDEFALHAFKGSSAYYHIAAINSLLRIANDPSLQMLHVRVVQTLMVIFDCLKEKMYATLSQVNSSHFILILIF